MDPLLSPLPLPAGGPEPLAGPLAEPLPQLVELLFERTQLPLRYLRPVEAGVAYYDLSHVERAVDLVTEDEHEQLLHSSRSWEPLGPVYLLDKTRQTLRWSDSAVPGSYHVGRVPEAALYRLRGHQTELPLNELVELLEQGPAAFRGYPVQVGRGEQRLQFTPPLAGEIYSESADWHSVSKWLCAGQEQVREGVHYQRYDEVDASGEPLGNCFIGQRAPEGEWLSPSGALEDVGKWLRQPGEVSGVNF